MSRRDETGAPQRQPRPRLTGRTVVLALVVLVLAVSFASSMQAYLAQRAKIADLKAEIARSEASIERLERELERWSHEAYVRAQARKRLGYLKPGWTGFIVLGKDGEPVGDEAGSSSPDDLSVPGEASRPVPEAWYADFWASVKTAGNPPPPSERSPALELGPSRSRR